MTITHFGRGQRPRVAVVGLGDIGSTVANALAARGYPLVLVSRRTRAELATAGLAELPADESVAVVPTTNAADHADVLLLAVPYLVAHETLTEMGDLTGKIVIDATNYNRERDGDGLDPGPGGTTDVLRAAFPAARWGKSFNMLWAGWLRTDADVQTPYRVVFLAADDSDVKNTVAELVRDSGFIPFDTGTLEQSTTRQLEGTPAWNQRLTVDEARAIMPDAPGPVGSHQ